MSITKQCTHLHQAPSTSTQLILTSTEPNLPPPCSFQPPPSSLQHRQRCWNQHIARNWATSPNLDRKSQSCAFWLKIGRHGILEGPVTNPDLDFVKYKPQNSFFGKFGPKKSKPLFCLKIGTDGISRMLILIPTLFSFNFQP